MSSLDKANSAILEDYDRLAKPAKKQAEEIAELQASAKFCKSLADDAFAKRDATYLALQEANATIAMLSKKYRECAYYFGEEGYPEYLKECDTILSNTQASTEAFMAEHAAKVLEELADWFNAPEQDAWEIADEIRSKAAELRASANRKDE